MSLFASLSSLKGIFDFLGKIFDEIKKYVRLSNRKKEIGDTKKEDKEIKNAVETGNVDDLNAKFGLPPGVPDIAIEGIIQALVASVDVTFKRMNARLSTGGIQFAIRGDVILSILDIPEGTIITEKGVPLNWLQWLLTRGNAAVVSGYKYIPLHHGRSGGGLMAKGSVFRVEPISFAGTVDNNFITRAFSGRSKELSRILRILFKG